MSGCYSKGSAVLLRGHTDWAGEAVYVNDPPDSWVVLLPHQCDEWEIGGAENLRALISDLQAHLLTIEKALLEARDSP